MKALSESLAAGNGLYDVFRRVSSARANHIALVDGELRLTYKELLQRVDSLAAELKATGISAGDRVALILPNGADFLAAAFATWERRAILVPLHIRYQEPEILRYVSSCGVRAILAYSKLEPLLESVLAQPASVEHVWISRPEGALWTYKGSGARRSSDAETPSDHEVDWPAVIQFSTGSTGTPKRVKRAHRQLIEESRSVAEAVGLTEEDRVLGAVPSYHSYGLGSATIFPLLAGATLYTVNDFFPRDVARLIERERITGLPGVPFIYQLLADQRGGADLSSLRYALSGGAPLSTATYQAFRATYGVSILQAYGSTETGMISIELFSEPGNFTVGPPIAGVSVRIVDEDGDPVPAGMPGRVSIVSPYATRGYDNLTGKSDSYFLNGTFFPGDLGSLQADGRLVLSGRTRQYINVAGNKVDPLEVESALVEHPAIAEAVALGVPDGAAGEKLKAVLVLSAPCTRAEVLAHCVAKLADFKRPRIIEFRDEIPKSPLGKILRKYLVDEVQATPV